MADHFIFTSHNDVIKNCFYDLFPEAGNEEIVSFVPTFKNGNSIIRRISISKKLNRFIPSFIVLNYYNLYDFNYLADDTYHIIIHTLTITKINIRCIESLKKKHTNIRIYALLNDSMDASSFHMEYVRDKLFSNVWDRVLTYDKEDADKYGFTWIGYCIYSSWDFVPPDAKHSDCYYVGNNKGNREGLVLDLYNRVKNSGLNARFDIVSQTPNPQGEPLYLKDGIPYSEVVSRVKSTNCIIEILQENQRSQSLRWFEAIAYNKKLLTNNRNIRTLPYYDERYMKSFEKVEDIDLEWLSKPEIINYGYHNEYSPLNLVEFIKNNLE